VSGVPEEKSFQVMDSNIVLGGEEHWSKIWSTFVWGIELREFLNQGKAMNFLVSKVEAPENLRPVGS